MVLYTRSIGYFCFLSLLYTFSDFLSLINHDAKYLLHEGSFVKYGKERSVVKFCMQFGLTLLELKRLIRFFS